MKLKQVAPNITLTTIDDVEFNLNQIKGKQIWLGFYRYSSCPLCNIRINEIIKRFNDFSSKGLEIVCVFQSPTSTMREFVGKQKPPFTLLSDTSEDSYRTYKLQKSLFGMFYPSNICHLIKAFKLGFLKRGKMDGTKTRIPGDFLIDENFCIQKIYYGKSFGDHIPLEQVYSFIES